MAKETGRGGEGGRRSVSVRGGYVEKSEVVGVGPRPMRVPVEVVLGVRVHARGREGATNEIFDLSAERDGDEGGSSPPVSWRVYCLSGWPARFSIAMSNATHLAQVVSSDANTIHCGYF